MTSLRETSDRGRVRVLKPDNVEPFSISPRFARLETVAEGSDVDVAVRARKLLGAAKQAED